MSEGSSDPKTGPPTLADKLANTRREHMLDAAVEAFAEKGFHRTTMKDIALGAGVSEGSIYNVFEDKRSLLFAMIERLEKGAFLAAPKSDPDRLMTLGSLLSNRAAALRPEFLKVSRTVLAEALVDEAFRTEVRDRLLLPALGPQGADRGDWPIDALDSKLLVGSVFGLALIDMLGAPFDEAERDALRLRLINIYIFGINALAAQTKPTSENASAPAGPAKQADGRQGD